MEDRSGHVYDIEQGPRERERVGLAEFPPFCGLEALVEHLFPAAMRLKLPAAVSMIQRENTEADPGIIVRVSQRERERDIIETTWRGQGGN